uniref:Uncharacterized protein n=1 Tax=Utricularia reniformis TaxID=192314 RepID=A0A1Y0B449_9LAMI|nr:hypothetical protein AEK19_MT1995 [Utricularia reniformis]ART32157.1 hypothetical protein AEK19_MT1995 [Utricularia reniformis]
MEILFITRLIGSAVDTRETSTFGYSLQRSFLYSLQLDYLYSKQVLRSRYVNCPLLNCIDRWVDGLKGLALLSGFEFDLCNKGGFVFYRL